MDWKMLMQGTHTHTLRWAHNFASLATMASCMLHADRETEGKQHQRGFTFDCSWILLIAGVSHTAVTPRGGNSSGRAPAVSPNASQPFDKGCWSGAKSFCQFKCVQEKFEGAILSPKTLFIYLFSGHVQPILFQMALTLQFCVIQQK